MHLPDPLSVVIVEGTVRTAAGEELLRRFVDVYNPKYGWNFEADGPMVVGGTFELVPRTVVAWRTVPVAECSTDMRFPSAAGRWTFG